MVEQLNSVLKHIHPHLYKAQMNWGVFVIEFIKLPIFEQTLMIIAV